MGFGHYKDLIWTYREVKQAGDYAIAVLHNWTGHSAFYTGAEFHLWLKLRGLAIASEAVIFNQYGEIAGEYREQFTIDETFFANLEALYCLPVLCNGAYSLGKAVRASDGFITIYCLNPNVPSRLEFNYFITRSMLEMGVNPLEQMSAEKFATWQIKETK